MDGKRGLALITVKSEVLETKKALDIIINYSQRYIKMHGDECRLYVEAVESGKNNLKLPVREPSPNISIFRIIMPSIEYLGQCFSGTQNQSAGAVNFIKEYFSKINNDYKEKAGFMWIVYRHSCIHQGSAMKIFSYLNRNIGVGFGYNDSKNHLKIDQSGFYIDIPTFFDDYVNATNQYIKDLESDDRIVEDFFKFYVSIADPICLESYIKKQVYLSERDLAFLNIENK